MLYIEYLIKIFLSIALGFIIGFERQIHDHEAGVKTHLLVCVGSCIFSILSYSIGSLDSGRLAAQIISGIGFLGAGTIIHHGNSVKGLTTAALIWVTASVGMAIGFGHYVLALIAVVVIQAILFIVKRYEHLWRK